jgi:hypothetical protein
LAWLGLSFGVSWLKPWLRLACLVLNLCFAWVGLSSLNSWLGLAWFGLNLGFVSLGLSHGMASLFLV